MKRTLEEVLGELTELVAPLDIADAHAVCERVRQQCYTPRAVVVGAAFFAMADDLFRPQVLDHLSRCTSLEFMAQLRLVCHDWRRWINALAHLRFGDNCWSGGIYDYLLTHQFTRCVAITSHQKILEQPLGFPQCSRITTLRLEQPGHCDGGISSPDGVDISAWCSLRDLSAPFFYSAMRGLADLTALTKLDVVGQVFGRDVHAHHQLTRLCNLQHLRIRYMAREVELVRHLTALTHLDSDQAAHFVHYHGAGRLEGRPTALSWIYGERGDDSDDDSSDEMSHAEQEALDLMERDFAAYGEGCEAASLKGHWCDGVFTGRAFLAFKQSYVFFRGHLVEGRRDGVGYESGRNGDKTTFHGRWRQGHRHGLGLFCTRVNVAVDNLTDNLTPVALEEWRHGTLVSSIDIASLARVPAPDPAADDVIVRRLPDGSEERVELDDDMLEELVRALEQLENK